MRNHTNKMLPMVVMVAAAALVMACGGMEEEQTVEQISESLELENGGLTMDDEMPMFGDLDLDALDVDVSKLDIPEEKGLEEYLGIQPKTSSTKKAPPPCPHGFLKGVWKKLNPNKSFGVYKGKWVSANGKVHGWLKGVFGKNKLGHGVFFGKYIDKNGKFKGLLKGHYGNGYFRGRYHGWYGGIGELRGVYGKNVFMGKWVSYCKARCNSVCKPGYIRHPYACFCVKLPACKKGQCPKGMKCDPCPKPAVCKLPNVKCPAVCGAPVCRPAKPLFPKSEQAPSTPVK